MRRLGHVVDLLAPADDAGAGAAPRRRRLDAGPLRRRHPARVGAAGGRAGRGAGRAGRRAGCPPTTPGIDVVVGDARAALTRAAARIGGPAGAGRVRRRPHPGARDRRGVPPPGGGRAGRGRVYAANVADGAALRVRPHPGGGGPRRVRARRRHGGGRRAARAPVRQPRAASRRPAPLPEAELARRAAADPFRARVLDAAQRPRPSPAGAVAPHDRDARPSPAPPPGFFGQ